MVEILISVTSESTQIPAPPLQSQKQKVSGIFLTYRKPIHYGTYTEGACRKLISVKESNTKKMPAENSATRGRESSLLPLCQLRTNKNEKTKCQKLI
jgi:hypothetical protein